MEVRFSKARSTPWGSPWGSPWSTPVVSRYPPANSNGPLPGRIHIIFGLSSSASRRQEPERPARAKPSGRVGERPATAAGWGAILRFIHDRGIPAHPTGRGLAKDAADLASSLRLGGSDKLDAASATLREIAGDVIAVLQAYKQRGSKPNYLKSPARAIPLRHRDDSLAGLQWLCHLAILHSLLHPEFDEGMTALKLARLAISCAPQAGLEAVGQLEPDNPVLLEIARDSLVTVRAPRKAPSKPS
jgi:hypothetical protein